MGLWGVGFSVFLITLIITMTACTSLVHYLYKNVCLVCGEEDEAKLIPFDVHEHANSVSTVRIQPQVRAKADRVICSMCLKGLTDNVSCGKLRVK